MLIVMKQDATREQVDAVVQTIREMGYDARPMPGRQRTTVGLVGNDGRVDDSTIEGMSGVAEVIHVSKPYKQVSREWKPEPTRVVLPDGSAVGGREVVV
ncbi:MAG TPA: 3-deoxy-7-phosphoheptulonate synthase, partial [Gemmatimonadales bacterium]|nr:3-deoxy-7-phosphoheptulonate synthase [Gemmatimonadales bacterium]